METQQFSKEKLDHNNGHKKGDGFTTMCFKGCATSLPPACLMNSAGERKLPWHTHTILTSWPFLYRYRNPSIFFPFGPSPVVDTHGMSSMMFLAAGASLGGLVSIVLFVIASSTNKISQKEHSICKDQPTKHNRSQSLEDILVWLIIWYTSS